MFDIFELYKKMERDNIILSFKGDITKDLLTSVFEIMESKLDSDKEEPRLKKKFNHVLVECLQNVYHHMEDRDNVKLALGDESEPGAIFIIARGDGNSYKIITGNHITNNRIDFLKTRIDKINSLAPDELKAFYLEMLDKSELSDKGGAGLGMIDIARKSGHNLVYSFDAVNDAISFFSLTVKIS